MSWGGSLSRVGAIALLIAFTFGVSGDRLRAQGTIFSARVSTVRIDVSVRQDGRAVRGLSAADFDVLDDGVQQEVELVGLEETPVNVVLALDMSGSVQGERLGQLRAAASRLLGLLEPRDTSALLTFTEQVTVHGPLSTDRQSLLTALSRPVTGRDTALVDATHAAIVLGAAATGRPLVIIFSDGDDTASFLSPDLVLGTAQRAGPVVYAVTSTPVEPGGFIDDLVRLTGGRRLDVSSIGAVADAFAEVLAESRERYLVSYTPRGVRAAGWHQLSVRVRGRRADVRARPGYLSTR